MLSLLLWLFPSSPTLLPFPLIPRWGEGRTLLATAAFSQNKKLPRPPTQSEKGVKGKATLIRSGKQWSLEFPCPLELAALLPEKPEPNKTPLVSVILQPGKTLAGRLSHSRLITIPLDDDDLAALSPGTNFLTVALPGYRVQRIPFDASLFFTAEPEFQAYVEARMTPLALPIEQTVPAASWSTALTFPTAPGFFSPKPTNRIVAAGSRFGKDFVSIPLSWRGRKLLLLVAAEYEGKPNELGKITAACADNVFISKSLKASELKDWHSVKPSSAAWHIVEIDLETPHTLEAVYIETTGKTSIAVAGAFLFGQLRSGTYATLAPRIQKFAAHEPITLFAFNEPSLQGWEMTGKAWGTTDSVGEFFNRKGTSRYFADSKVGGEQATGTILSPPFTITGSKLTFLANGHSAKNFYSLVDATNGNELMRSPVPEKTGAFEKIIWDVKSFRKRLVRFKATDGDDKTAYAWLAFDAITLEP